jgi:hypothetical protein
MKTKTATADTATQVEDDFLSSMRISTDYLNSEVGVKRILLTVPVRKPGKAEFIRVHPELHIDLLAIELKEERETYFAVPALGAELSEFVAPVRLRLAVTRQKTAFLWPLKLPMNQGRVNPWHDSAIEAAALGETNWMRVSADMGLGAYQPAVARADLGEPQWPSEPWSEIVRIALKGKVIDSLDHAVVRQLLGLT